MLTAVVGREVSQRPSKILREVVEMEHGMGDLVYDIVSLGTLYEGYGDESEAGSLHAEIERRYRELGIE